VFKALRTLRLMRLFKLLKLNAIFERIEAVVAVNHHMLRLLKLLIVAVIGMHFAACVWYTVGNVAYSNGEKNTNTKYTCDTGQTRNKLLAQRGRLDGTAGCSVQRPRDIIWPLDL
jgi:hypothetical protein